MFNITSAYIPKVNSSSTYVPNHLSNRIQKINKEYNEYIKTNDIVNPENDGSTEIKIKWQYYNSYKDIRKFIEDKTYEQQKEYYAETSAMSNDRRREYIHQRYYDKNAAHYIGEGYTKNERDFSYETELHFNPKWHDKYHPSNTWDPMFRGIRSRIPRYKMEVAGKKLFTRKKINQVISNILEKNNIKLSKDDKLTFSIDPFSYKISVEGTDDKELKQNLENALNINENGKYLFYHVSDTLSDNSEQKTKDKEDKYYLMEAIRDATGYNINELKKEGKTLVNEKGEDVFSMFEKEYSATVARHLSDGDKAIVIGSYRLRMHDFIDGKLKDTPDMVLKIDYQDGSLMDRNIRGYGKGQRAWLSDFEKTLRKEVVIYEINDTSFYAKRKDFKKNCYDKKYLRGNFFDSNNIRKYIDLNSSFFDSEKVRKSDDTDFLDPVMAQQKARMIAIKVAKGQDVSKEELKFIEKYNPELLEKAQMAHEQAKIFKLNNDVDDPKVKMRVLVFIDKISKVDPVFGELMFNAFM